MMGFVGCGCDLWLREMCMMVLGLDLGGGVGVGVLLFCWVAGGVGVRESVGGRWYRGEGGWVGLEVERVQL